MYPTTFGTAYLGRIEGSPRPLPCGPSSSGLILHLAENYPPSWDNGFENHLRAAQKRRPASGGEDKNTPTPRGSVLLPFAFKRRKLWNQKRLAQTLSSLDAFMRLSACLAPLRPLPSGV